MRHLSLLLVTASLAGCSAIAVSAPPSAPLFDAPSITCIENGNCAIVINKSAPSKSYSKIEVLTVPGEAKPGVDYQTVDTILTVGSNTLSVRVPLPLINDNIYRGSRAFGIALRGLRNAQIKTTMAGPTTVTINDDEPQPLPPVPCADGTSVPAGQSCPSPVPVPEPTPTPLPIDTTGEAPILDNFDGSAMLEATWYGPTGRGGIAPTPVDPVGAFRFFCGPGQILRDDPIANPGQPGVAHPHQFIGNISANAHSTYQSLRTAGGSTCDNRSTPDKAFNRSSYWMPAMLDGSGSVVPPDYALVYYKRIPKGHPSCGAPDTTHIGFCTDMPNGIRFIFGYDMKTMTGGPMQIPSWDRDAMTFDCEVRHGGGAQAVPGIFHNIAEVVAAGCPVGTHLKISIGPPTCWDGKNLDVADHRSHVVYADGPFVVSAGERACPPTHPYYLPNLAYQWYFTTNSTFTAGKWRLSSDDMMSQMMGKTVIPGSTLHMDYFEAWSPTIKAEFHAYCINLHRNCNNGDLGNGVQMKEAGVPPAYFPIPALVPLSDVP